jgi:uncharacterized protein (TIGR02594 family)
MSFFKEESSTLLGNDMTFPKGYEWLSEVGLLPKTISEAFKEFGTVETPGHANNPKILSWAKEVGLEKTYSSDSIPWCGLFAAVIAKRAGKAVVEAPLWARNWPTFGLEVARKDGEKLKFFSGRRASLGDVMVFVRDGGGHVAFYLGETPTHYLCIGGNQSDKVCIAAMPKSRCIAVRRPTYNNQPASVKPYILGGVKVIEGSEA